MADASFCQKKILKPAGGSLNELEEAVARAFVELEHTSKDLSGELRDLVISSVKQIDTSNNNKVVVIFVPYRQHKRFQKIQNRLIRELEKKFSGKHVCFIAQRTILSQQHKRKKGGQLRPQSRTLTSVQNAILEDIVYPYQIVGKRIRVRQDSSKLLKVFLDPKDVKDVEYKLKSFNSVYKALTNNQVEFMFPVVEE